MLFDVERVMPAGSKEFTFGLHLPESIPQSYYGVRGWIEYQIEGHIEISWAFDVKATCKIQVLKAIPPKQPRQLTAIDEDDGVPVLEVVVPNDIVFVGEELKFKLRVHRNIKMRGIRAEIQSQETVHARGRTRNADKILFNAFLDNEEMRKDRWMDMAIPVHHNIEPSFTSELISLEVLLKVTIDVPFAFDKSVMMPLNVIEGSVIQIDTENERLWSFDM